MRALALVALVLGADGGTPRLEFSGDLDLGPSAWPLGTRVTHEGRYPDGTRLLVHTSPGHRLVPQPPHVEWAFTIEAPDGGSRYATVPAGTELHQVDGGVVDLGQAKGHEHCWHMSPLQHTVTQHQDDYCCHCGAERCVHLSWPGICGKGHGPRCEEPQMNLNRKRSR